jgi:protein translocase SecG subunit
MQNILPFIQGGLSILLIAAILLQQRGTDLGSAFGGSSASFNTRRGLEKKLFTATIILGILFFASIVARFFI